MGVWDLGGWLLTALRHLAEGILIAWAALAIYYSPIRSVPRRRSLAAAFAIFAVWALWLEREPVPLLLLSVAYLIVVMGWFSIRPSNDRPWRPEFRVTPRARFDGDRVRILGVRNFEYRSTSDFRVR